jgi:drug/metabolite transporter (DMT)-like permease
MNNSYLNAIVITSFGVLLMSLESLLVKLTSIEAITFSFYIGLFMFFTINIVLFSSKKQKIIQVYKDNLKSIVLCGFLFGISNIFFINAIKTTTVANTVMIFASIPLFSSLYNYLIYRKKSTKNIYIASFFIFIGLFIIFSTQIGDSNFLGNIYALICVNLFSLAFVILSQYKNVNRFAITAFAGFVTAIVSSLFINYYAIDLYTLGILLITGIIVAPMSRILIGIGTKRLPASEVSLLMIIETIMAPIWVWIFLNEIPQNTTFIGGSIILLTLILNSIYSLKINKQRIS